ncbi:Lrp/AsnC ligand binding domain-containing protein [Pseudoroseomonas wenyumeiae]
MSRWCIPPCWGGRSAFMCWYRWSGKALRSSTPSSARCGPGRKWEAWYVTGEADFLLHLQLADMAEYDAFTRAVFHEEPNVRAFRTVIAMRQVVG